MKEGGVSKGILCGVGAYALWGLFPLYWKMLRHVSAFELIGHRIVWSFIFLILFIVFTRKWHNFYSSINRQNCAIYLVASLLIGANWIMYVWAVNAGHMVETSLGYFINPLLGIGVSSVCGLISLVQNYQGNNYLQKAGELMMK